MENYTKIQSSQGIFDTSGQKNLCDFHIPANSGSYDMSKSFINVNVKVATTSTDAVEGDADAPAPVYNTGIVFNESNRGTANAFSRIANPDSAVLVKNARMVSARGKLEDLRNVACLRTNLGVFEKNEKDQEDGTYAMSNDNTDQLATTQPLNSLVAVGDFASETRNHNIRVPLSSVFELGHESVYDSAYHGNTRISLELNLDKLAVINKTTATETNNRYNLTGGAEKYNEFKDQTKAGAGTDTLGSADYPLVSKIEYASLEDSPWYVGQRCSLTATNANGATAIAGAKIVQIKKITWCDAESKFPNDAGGTAGDSKGCVAIELTAGLGAMTATQGYTTIVMNPQDPTTSPIVINNIELVAKQTSEKDMNGLQYTTYTAQEDSFPVNSASLNRTYQLPPNCINVYVMFNNPVYSFEDIDTYRLTLNNIDQTSRDVKMNGSLHYDLLSKVFQNKDAVVGSLEGKLDDSAKHLGEANQEYKVSIIACPVQLSGSPTQLGIEVVGTNLGGKVIVYSEVVKEI